MSDYQTPESIEAARDARQADYEGRASDATYEATKGHPLKYPKHSRGPFREPQRRAWCLGCGRAVSDWGDYDDAKRAGDQHVSSVAHAAVAGVGGE